MMRFPAALLLLAAIIQQPHATEMKRDPAAAARANNIGCAYMSQQRFDKALQQFTTALKLDPDLKIARLNEAIALANLQKTDEARAILEATTKAEPENARAWYNLGLIFKNAGDAEHALAPFERAVKLAGNDADAHYFLAVTLSELKRDAGAVNEFEAALRLNPYHASAEFGLSRALLRLNKQDDARQHLQRFQQLTTSHLGKPVSLAYGDQGALSYALEAREGASAVEPPIKVTFVPVGAWDLITYDGPLRPLSQIGLPLGACWFDYDGDGRPDLFSASFYGRLFHNDGGKFSDASAATHVAFYDAVACAAADYDNDGHTDLAVSTSRRVVLLRNNGDGTLADVTESAGLANTIANATGLLWIDYDHDGDVDLIVTAARGITVFRNNGNGKFTDVTEQLGITGGGFESAALTDFNNDRAVDLVFSGETAVFKNPREGKWKEEKLLGDLQATVNVAVLDFNRDGFMDLALTHRAAPAVSLLRNVNGNRFQWAAWPVKLKRAWGIAALDYDNDGWVDLAVAGEDETGKPTVRLLRNEGTKGFRDVSQEVGLAKVTLSNRGPITLTAVDYDGDGATDLLISAPDYATLLRNVGGAQNHSLTLSLKGLNDNKSAIGAKVEVFAGALYQKFEITNAAPLTIGLGKNTSADILRMLWPTGVLQDEAEVPAKATQVTEIDRRGSSCPVLFAWDGARYRFVSDMIGAGVVGHWIAPGERNVADPTEYLKIDFPVEPRNRRLSFRFMEPMEETVYLDAVRLLAIDHPTAAQVTPNEYFASNPPFPEFKIISSIEPKPVAAAFDAHGRDVTTLLSNADHRFVEDFTLLPYKGFTKAHTLTLDLGVPYDGGPLRLLMRGYIEYFTATSMYAAHQAGLDPVAPYINALTPDGKWVRVTDDMGFPAGLYRTTVADLTGKLPHGTQRIRITTNLQIYWDQVLIDRTPSGSAAHTHEVPLASAALRFRGYPRAVEGKTPGDLSYIYEQVSATGPYTRQNGEYTRYGDVRDLLRRADDRFVVFGSGEEVALEFDPATLPPLPPGWKRDYFFFADGFEKDMDFYAADFLSVEPLPAHGPGQYPDSLRYPEDAEHLRYRLEYNTRSFSGSGAGEYRFHYANHP